MSPESLGLFLFTCLVIELTPGPNMAYLAMLSMTTGKRAGFMTVAGIALGLLCIGILALLAILSLITASPVVLGFVHICGIFYLLWLAWQSWQENEEISPDVINGKNRTLYFRRGFIINVLNAKAFLFYVTVLPEFIWNTDSFAWSALLLILISVAIATVVHSFIVLLAARMRVFVTHSIQRKMIRKISALLLLALAAWLALLYV